MTITTDVSRSSRWTSDGYNRTWSYPFKALTSDSMVLLVTDNAGFETSVIAGFQANNLGQDGGGTVIYPIEPAPPLPAGYTVVVMRRTPRQQPYKIGAQGRFFPETHEKALDNLEMQIQELSLSVERAVRVPLSDTEGMGPLPDLAHRANKLLAFDADGNPSTANVSVEEILAARDAAAASAVEADYFQGQANAILGDMRKQFLGAFTTPPTENWDQTALIPGAEYFNLLDGTRYNWTGSAWIAAGAAAIPSNFVDNTRLVDMPTKTIKGRNTAGTGDPEDLTMATVRSMIGTFAAGQPGLVTDPVSGDVARFLRADGSWSPPPQSVVAAYMRVSGGVPASSLLEVIRDGGIYMMANGVPKVIPAGGLNMSAVAWGLSVNADYFIGVADLNNDGILDDMKPFWVGASSYANDPTTYLPVIVQDTRYALVGRVRIGSSGGTPVFVDTETQRWTCSYYNPRQKALRSYAAADIATGAYTGYVIMPDLAVTFVQFGGSLVQAAFTGAVDNPDNGSNSAGTVAVLWAIDDVPTDWWGMAQLGLASWNATGVAPTSLDLKWDFGEGYHSLKVAWRNFVAGQTARRMGGSAITGSVWG